MRSFALALTFAGASALHQVELKYMNYLAKFGKNMNSLEEFDTRLELFTATDLDISEINAGNNTWTAGHNQFSDWSEEEYKGMLGLKMTNENSEVVVFSEENLADEVNWVTAGAVTGVKNQGACGSCWSFSTTGSTEGAHFIATGELLSFSEQQLVDCATGIYLNMGCNGGNPLWAYRYLKSHYAELETEYPYTSGGGDDSTDCLYDEHSKTAVKVVGSASVTQDSSSQMKAALSQQPLSVLIEADKRVFQTYSSGVLTSTACGTQLDHAVLAVGYGTENGQDYWLVKNSWDTTWGDNGYIKLGMDSSTGTCGVQMGPSFPTAN
jgi:C1A family cysteine protease